MAGQRGKSRTHRPISPPTGHFQNYSFSQNSEVFQFRDAQITPTLDLLTTRTLFLSVKPEINLAEIAALSEKAVPLWICGDVMMLAG